MAVPEAVLDRVRQQMRAGGLKAPGHYDRVYKEECMFSFDTPLSPGGLYVNLRTYQGFGRDFVELDHQKTGNVLYLHEKWKQVPIAAEEVQAAGQPSKLAIGGDGGFQVDKPKHTTEKEHELVLLPDYVTVALPCPDLPELVLQTINGIIAHESASSQEKVAAWEEERRVSKYAENLPQLDTGRKIPSNPKEWRCDETGVAENLWLNLSTGNIGSGRQNWDGSGGNGSAMRHYEATGCKYPLVVKLGTITPSGADVYSYAGDEDDMVTDPHLAQHLAHWGINMMQMEKTEKTMAELQIDLNLAFEFDRITESGGHLQPLHGPGAVGLVNLGNSCYMNSVLQVLFSVPELAARYVQGAPAIFQSAPQDPASDLPTQVAKVGVALVTARTGAPPHADDSSTPMDTETTVAAADGTDAEGAALGRAGAAAAEGGRDKGAERDAVRPASFKALVGKGHPEFSSARQQDAAEFWEHLTELMARAEHAAAGRLGLAAAAAGTASSSAEGAAAAGVPPTSAMFTFNLEDRIQCLGSSRVSYKSSVHKMLSLDVPLEAAINKSDVEEYRVREAKRQRLRDVDGATAYIGQEATIANDAGAVLDGAGGVGEGSRGGGDGGVSASVVTVGEGKEEPVLPRVPLAACLERFAAAEVMDDYYSAALQRKGQATKRSRFASFPPYLLIKLNRYYVDRDWTPKKLEVEVDVPTELNLEQLRSSGQAPGEQLQPEDSSTQQGQGAAAAGAAPAAAPEPDPQLVSALVGMGFSENGSKRAALAVNNSNAEAAMEWVFAHMEDADFNDPLPDPAAVAAAAPAAGTGSSAVDAEALSNLTAMGFSDEAASAALKSTGGNIERAADWLFSHMDDLEQAVAAVNAQQQQQQQQQAGAAAAGASTGAAASAAPVVDGPGRYRLKGFISHMGSNTACGHYVAHIIKDGRWVIFNDDKVAASTQPPLTLGYMYLFERVQEGQQ